MSGLVVATVFRVESHWNVGRSRAEYGSQRTSTNERAAGGDARLQINPENNNQSACLLAVLVDREHHDTKTNAQQQQLDPLPRLFSFPSSCCPFLREREHQRDYLHLGRLCFTIAEKPIDFVVLQLQLCLLSFYSNSVDHQISRHT